MPLSEVKESNVDVLVIGAGPAGLMCAYGLAQAGINVRIIDKRPEKISAGQAGSVNPRTIEVLQSYGLGDRLIREGSRLYVSTYYQPGPNGIERAGEAVTIAHPKARYPFNISLSQPKIENIFLDSLRSLGVTVDRPIAPTHIELSEDTAILKDPSTHAIKVVLENLDAPDTSQCCTEIVHAKFVVGCDGAHSWVRKSLGIVMEGDQTDFIWGAVDIIPDTDFPDVRKISIIRSDNGSCMIIPRENDMIRLYMQLSDTDILDPATGQLDRNKMSPEQLLEVARKSMHPYKIGNPEGLNWWTVYIIGQRLASKFSVYDRIFIAGDACHTHSPKAGQGMNASINDAHNLVWKMVLVLRGCAEMPLLQTYASERMQFAQDLIALDKKYAASASGKTPTTDSMSFKQLADKHRGFASGIGICYSESAIVQIKHQACARNLTIGERVPPQILICVADARPYELQDLLPADARFKILIFTGDITDGTQRTKVQKLAEEMGKPGSFLKRFSGGTGLKQVFDIYTIGSGKKERMSPTHLPVLFKTHWSKFLVDDLDTTGTQGGKAYMAFGIEPSGAVVVVRPDGYVAAITPFDSIHDLNSFFASFMTPLCL